jgi:hypothetical protein
MSVLVLRDLDGIEGEECADSSMGEMLVPSSCGWVFLGGKQCAGRARLSIFGHSMVSTPSNSPVDGRSTSSCTSTFHAQ